MRTQLQFTFLLILFLSIRLIGIDLFPPLHPDEGLWLSAPKNFVLFGDPFLDGRLHFFLSPLTFVLHAVIFSLVGPGILTARLVSSIIGTFGALSLFSIRVQKTNRWLFPLCTGVSSLLILCNRRGMTEAPQVALLCCFLALLYNDKLKLAAVVCALAIVTKANSLIILPAFFTYIWFSSNKGAAIRSLSLCMTPLVLAGAVYGLLYFLYPIQFTAAFMYELDGVHFLESGQIIQIVGRFGLNISQLKLLGKEIVKSFPVLLPLGLAGSFLSLRWDKRTPFSLSCLVWLYGGALFYLLQIFTPPRYLLTLLPPLAYFTADIIIQTYQVCSFYISKRFAIVFFVLITVIPTSYHVLRVGLKVIAPKPRSTSYALTTFSNRTLPRAAKILAAPYHCIDISQHCFDFYRALKPYGASGGPNLSEVIAKYSITHIFVDSEFKGLLPHRISEVEYNSKCSFNVLDVKVHRTYETYQNITEKESQQRVHLPCQ
jgi:hypothetical protein